MGKLREVSGRQPPWNGTKKQGRAWAGERALKNRIRELEVQLERAEAEKREQAHAIAKAIDDLANMRNRAETAEARIREMTGAGGLARGLYTVKEHEEIVQQKIREYAADFMITVCARSRR